MSQVIGNASLTPGRDGLGIAVDLLDVQAARDVVTLIGASVPVFARPLLDMEASDTTEGRREGSALRVRRAVFGAVLVKPVAGGVRNLSPVALSRAVTREGGFGGVGGGRPETRTPSQAILRPSTGRRRLWL